MQTFKLRELCDFEKGSTGLAKAEPGDYPLVTTGAERKTCNTYQFDTKAVCIPLVSSTGHGHASLKNVHFQEGRFALGSILVALTSKNEEKLDIQFLHLYLSQLKDKVLVPLMSGAANVALSVKKIQGIEIPLPPINRQREIVEKFKSVVAGEDELKSELNHQQTLLKNLRQQILQEAIEGKLTANWRAQNPNVEPARKLLEDIVADKAQLVKDKKIKAQKPLLPITDEEKPFELPQGWEWCRLGEIADAQDPNPSHRMPSREVNGVPFISPVNVDEKGNINFETGKRVSMSVLEDQKSRYTVMPHSFAFSRIGTIGDVFKLPLPHNYCLSYSLSVITPVLPIMEDFLMRVISSNVVLKQAILGTTKNTIPDLGMQTIRSFVLPLPSLDEQKVIFQKIEYLMTVCDKLATLIARNKGQAEQLMHAVLKEAFNHNSEAEIAASLSKVSAHLPEVLRA